MTRRAFITLINGLAIAWPLASYAQQPIQPLKRVGFLAQVGCPIPSDWVGIRHLAALGWVEGRNFVFDCVTPAGRWDQISALARELVSRRPDVLITSTTPFAMALKQETRTIPIVMVSLTDPVRTGLITSLARPEGNVTGVTWLGPDLISKRMELLKEIVPQLRRVAFIGGANLPDAPRLRAVAEEQTEIAASTLGFTWQAFGAASANDFDTIFARVAAEHFDAAYIFSDILTNANQNWTRICQLALRHRIPTISEDAGWARCGLLVTYGQDGSWTSARAMDYVDKILRGAKPSDLPVEQAPKVQLTINLKTAKALGLTIPPSLLTRADEVIE